jgi:hypothetical protein
MRDPEGMLLMKTYGMLFIVMLMLVLTCFPVHSQDREAAQEVSFFTG